MLPHIVLDNIYGKFILSLYLLLSERSPARENHKFTRDSNDRISLFLVTFISYSYNHFIK